MWSLQESNQRKKGEGEKEKGETVQIITDKGFRSDSRSLKLVIAKRLVLNKEKRMYFL